MSPSPYFLLRRDNAYFLLTGCFLSKTSQNPVYPAPLFHLGRVRTVRGTARLRWTSPRSDRRGGRHEPIPAREIRVDNYRCFEELRLPLEEDTTILFAENGGGKTALLTALAMGLAVIQRDAPKTLKLKAGRDSRRGVPNDKGAPEPAGPCEVKWTAAVGETETVTWSTVVQPASGRTRNQHRPIFEAVEAVRVPGVRWPLFAWYGVDRLRRSSGRHRKVERARDRWEAYDSSLDPNLDEAPLLQWLQDEMLGT